MSVTLAVSAKLGKRRLIIDGQEFPWVIDDGFDVTQDPATGMLKVAVTLIVASDIEWMDNDSEADHE